MLTNDEDWSEVEYDRAMKRIDEIFHAVPGTQEGEELEALVKAVEVYESFHFPIAEPSIQEAGRFRCEQENKHLPMKSALDTSFYCTRCGVYLGETSSQIH